MMNFSKVIFSARWCNSLLHLPNSGNPTKNFDNSRINRNRVIPFPPLSCDLTPHDFFTAVPQQSHIFIPS
jgi:hypothetical protein